jgi:glutathione synthase/RimK-type ligase-like ATP-grasp enzyme
MYSKAFYIAVDPVGSKFARAIQGSVRSKVANKVLRVSQQRAVSKVRKGRSCFQVTPYVLNKIQQFQKFSEHGVSAPAWTTDRQKATELGSKVVFCRTLINSTGGRGIVEVNLEAGQQLVQAPLYTAYIPKKAEYRLHVFGDKVIDIQQKKKKREFNTEERDTRVRNLHNGYVYCRDNVVPPAGIKELAINAVKAVGYKYGAVDIIYNEKLNKCFVLEVNSRPGLMGTTVENYAEALVSMYDLRRK